MTSTPVLMPCPCCGEKEASVDVRLWALGEGNEFFCNDCNTEFCRDEVTEMLSQWQRWVKLMAWVEQVPTVE
jgi:hypothetical protein